MIDDKVITEFKYYRDRINKLQKTVSENTYYITKLQGRESIFDKIKRKLFPEPPPRPVTTADFQ